MGETWKRVEREIAKRFGTVRNLSQGLAVPDVVTHTLSIEVKSRRSLPKWLSNALKQAEDNCVSGTLPLVVLHESGELYNDALVIMRLKDFLRPAKGEGEALDND